MPAFALRIFYNVDLGPLLTQIKTVGLRTTSRVRFLDGVYVERPDGTLRFRWVKAPTSAELTRLTQTLALRVGPGAFMPFGCKPRVHLTRFNGVFAPNSKYRARVTPAKRGRGAQRAATGDWEEPTPAERRAAMSWAQRLKRVFGIGIETCPACGGAVRIIASIEDPVVIGKILAHVGATAPVREVVRLPGSRAPRVGWV